MTDLFALPNELILSIFDTFTTRELLNAASTCRHVYIVILRLLQARLCAAQSLGDYSLWIECHHPSARLTAGRLHCTSMSTDGLQELCDELAMGSHSTDQLGRMHNLYTRFRPQRREPELPQVRPGDVPGSRTYITSRTAQYSEELVMDTVTVDANDLFTQLSTASYLGKRETRLGLLLQDIIEGTVRVWRDWLSKHCESRTFSDHTTLDIADTRTANPDPMSDSNVLWVNSGNHSLGLRLKVKSQRRRMTAAPLIYQSELDLAVSYIVQYEEILIRTSLILLKMEEAERQISRCLPPAFLLPAFAPRSFSTTTPAHARKDGNSRRGMSPIKGTGLGRRYKVSVDLDKMPQPVKEPAGHKNLQSKDDHGLWGFFRADRQRMIPPSELSAHGRAWTVAELRRKDFDDLWKLHWRCVKEINMIRTSDLERRKVEYGHGDFEAATRVSEIKKTMKAIKHTLTERYYEFDSARQLAMDDPEINLYADTAIGEKVYNPIYGEGEAELYDPTIPPPETAASQQEART